MTLVAGSVKSSRSASGDGQGIPISLDVQPYDGTSQRQNVENPKKFYINNGDSVLVDTLKNEIAGVFSTSTNFVSHLPFSDQSNIVRNQQSYIIINYPNGMSIHVPITITM